MTEAKNEANKELAELKAKCEEYLAGWQRAQADYQNLTREHEQQMKHFLDFGKIGLLAQLLPIIDHYELALVHVPVDKEKEEWVQGFFHIKKQLDELLVKLEIKKMETIGQQFDPQLHEAVATKDSAAAEGEIIEEAQAGYMFKDKVLRHAKVTVNKNIKCEICE